MLSNTDAVALDSLAEIVADYRENGQGVASSLSTYEASNNAALARIDLLETFIVSLQDLQAVPEIRGAPMYWKAQIYNNEGIRLSKFFSIDKLGEESKTMAINERKRLETLYGYIGD